MPAKSVPYWRSRQPMASPCHYGEPWNDAYATWIRRLAVRRLWSPEIRTILDVGCGDGRFGRWMAGLSNARVTGVDAFRFRGMDDRLDGWWIGDGETVDIAWEGREPVDVATYVTSLPFMRDWRQALASGTRVAKRIMVVENLQTPTPEWQKGLESKTPFEYAELVAQMGWLGWELERSVCVNVIDRRWLHDAPKRLTPAIAAVTLVADAVLSRIVAPEDGRYAALMFVPMEGPPCG